jgi:hypothetical protein
LGFGFDFYFGNRVSTKLKPGGAALRRFGLAT